MKHSRGLMGGYWVFSRVHSQELWRRRAVRGGVPDSTDLGDIYTPIHDILVVQSMLDNNPQYGGIRIGCRLLIDY